jgi:hypothetical protein
MGQTAEQAQHRASEAADQTKAQAQVNTCDDIGTLLYCAGVVCKWLRVLEGYRLLKGAGAAPRQRGCQPDQGPGTGE